MKKFRTLLEFLLHISNIVNYICILFYNKKKCLALLTVLEVHPSSWPFFLDSTFLYSYFSVKSWWLAKEKISTSFQDLDFLLFYIHLLVKEECHGRSRIWIHTYLTPDIKILKKCPITTSTYPVKLKRKLSSGNMSSLKPQEGFWLHWHNHMTKFVVFHIGSSIQTSSLTTYSFSKLELGKTSTSKSVYAKVTSRFSTCPLLDHVQKKDSFAH